MSAKHAELGRLSLSELALLSILSILWGGGCSAPPSYSAQTAQTAQAHQPASPSARGAPIPSPCPPLLSSAQLTGLSEEVGLSVPPRHARAPTERGAWALNVSGALLTLGEGGSLSVQGWRWLLSARGGAQALPPTPTPHDACAVTQRWVTRSDQLWLLTRFSAQVTFEGGSFVSALVSDVEGLLRHPTLTAARGALFISSTLARELEGRGALTSLEERGWRPSFQTLNSAPSEGRVWVAFKRRL